MTKLLWGKVGDRYFESGVDRGVLFINSLGVAWNGLKSVRESAQGGSPKAFYIDGVKYLNISEAEEFQATIDAFSAPDEFSVCDGSKTLYAGLSATHQPRKTFGLSYRTKIGNDISGLDLGYKIHIVYNALAGPSSRDRTSLGGSTDPISLSWPITTTPPIVEKIRPTAHFIIDSRTSRGLHLDLIENILYGTDLTNPRLPLAVELVDIFSHSSIEIIDNGNLTFTAIGSSNDVSMIDADTFRLSHPAVTDNGDGTFSMETGVTDG